MNTIWAFIRALPEIVKLLIVLEKAIKQGQADRKVAADIKTIHEAFAANDPAKLNALFNAQ